MLIGQGNIPEKYFIPTKKAIDRHTDKLIFYSNIHCFRKSSSPKNESNFKREWYICFLPYDKVDYTDERTYVYLVLIE